MKRFLLLLALGAASAVAIWLGLRSGRLPGSSGSLVISLLPKETLAFIHLPDLNETRAKWHETDIYKLWREPAMRDFLQRPLAKMPNAGAMQQKLQELHALEIKDAFLAITSWENNQAKLLSGFRFKGNPEDVEKMIGKWRTDVGQNAAAARRETIPHEQHRIGVVTEGSITIATVYDRQWFFAANDVAALKTLLDRADARLKEPAATLRADEAFAASFKRMPGNYAVLAHVRLDRYLEKMLAQRPAGDVAGEPLGALRQIRSITAASRIEDGKFRDVLFVAMPERGGAGALTRSSLSLTTADSFLYAAGFLKLPNQMPPPEAGPSVETSGFAAALQRLAAILSTAGVRLQDWNDAFGSEFGINADWVQNSRLPSLAASLPVKDGSKARAIIAAIVTATAEDRDWAESEKDGVQYYSKPPISPMLPIALTVALSNRILVIAQDPGFAETVVMRSKAASTALATSTAFKAAERLVGAPTHAFSYIDAALFYQRLDAAVRPMLVMAAAFMPGLSETVELGKLPTADVITRHLSPMVMAQRYERDGYLTESAGPLSIYQAAVVLGVTTGAGQRLYQKQIQATTNTPGAGAGALPAVPALPSASPDEMP